jgi:hypothetical protein
LPGLSSSYQLRQLEQQTTPRSAVREALFIQIGAASVDKLIFTTETFINDLEEDEVDPTAGPALGGHAERPGRA